VVTTHDWDAGSIVDAGAVTWGNGATGTAGVVSESNSLVGSTAGDQIGQDYFGVAALENGNYVIVSAYWDNGAIADAGAVTWGNAIGGVSGRITAQNSVRGTAEGVEMSWAYDGVNRQLVVGRVGENIVTLFRVLPAYPVFLPAVLKNGP
jgi:hypothetical protein